MVEVSSIRLSSGPDWTLTSTGEFQLFSLNDTLVGLISNVRFVVDGVMVTLSPGPGCVPRTNV